MTNSNQKSCEDIFDTSTNFFHIFSEMVSSGDLKKMGVYCFTVYAVIKSHANINTGNCFPSINKIIDETGISERQVQGCLKKLEGMGYLEVKRTTGKSNEYTLKEKFIMHDTYGEPTAVASFNYIPTAIKKAMAEIKNFRVTGEHDGKIVHINNLIINLQINNNCEVVMQNNDKQNMREKYADWRLFNIIKTQKTKKTKKTPPA